MVDLFQAIKSTAQEQASTNYPVPSGFLTSANFLSRVSLFGWAIREPQLFAERPATEGNPLVYGGALHLLTQYSTTVNFIVNIGIISKCVNDLITQHQQLHDAYTNLKNVFYDEYPRYHKYHWKNLNKSTYFQTIASIHIFAYTKAVKLLDQAARIMRCLGRLIVEVFKLGTIYTDIYLIAKGDALAHMRACTSLVSNMKNYQKQLSEKYSELLQVLEKNESSVNSICQKMGLNKRNVDIIADLRRFAEQAGKALPVVVNATQEFLDPILTVGKITPMFNLTVPEQAKTVNVPPQGIPAPLKLKAFYDRAEVEKNLSKTAS